MHPAVFGQSMQARQAGKAGRQGRQAESMQAETSMGKPFLKQKKNKNKTKQIWQAGSTWSQMLNINSAI